MRKQDLIDQVLDGRSPDVEQVTHLPLIVHESTSILRTLDLFRKTPVHTAIVVDEFGALQGIVTRTDLLEAVAGDLPKIDAPARPKITQREDGSYLVDASVPFLEVMVSSSRSCMNCRSRETILCGAAGDSRWSTSTPGAST